ncbi:MAG: ribonuclease III [bacterium]|nr:ribonuclease III [bacterium]
MEKDFLHVQEKIDISFKNVDTLRQAMVHRSYLNENPSFELGHNERLEFLGDAVLELVVTDYLYTTFPRAAEGEMTSWRASLVNSKMLASIAQELDIEPLLYLSRGEAKDVGSKGRQYILTNALEALIGAIYIDQGYTVAEKFIHTYVIPRLAGIFEYRLDVDPKSHFQEIAQEHARVTPHYDVLEEKGPDHAKWFKVGVFLGKELVATGEGTSKQEAQVQAAQNALEEKGWK